MNESITRSSRPRVGAATTAARRDAGATLIEILISLVLLGIAVTAILVALRATTKASGIDEDHAIAFAWLQDASEEIYRAPREACDAHADPAAEIRVIYDAYAKTATNPYPSGGGSIAVTEVQFLGKASPDDDYGWDASYCLEGGDYAEAPQYTQRLTIQVTTPEGIVKTLQMVKGKT